MPGKNPEQPSKPDETVKSAEKVRYQYSRNELLMFKNLKVCQKLPDNVVLPAEIDKALLVPAKPEEEEHIEDETTQARYF